ncbi:hypothetical protein C8R44DRAFT_909643 [Mycena epipterygia]|nr:hypothetical protein C8R44DRAFT_909643 [Mycena epipterygia]
MLRLYSPLSMCGRKYLSTSLPKFSTQPTRPAWKVVVSRPPLNFHRTYLYTAQQDTRHSKIWTQKIKWLPLQRFCLRRRLEYKRWHQSRESLPEEWSCDWGMWDDRFALRVWQHELNEWGATVRFEPLAFKEIFSPCGPVFVFAAAGRYYYYSNVDSILSRFEGSFKSHDEFLRRFDGEWDRTSEIVAYEWVPVAKIKEEQEDRERGYIILDQDPVDGKLVKRTHYD